jgi:integrase
MTRDEHGRLRLDCKLGTYYHSLSTSECLDAELSEAYSAWPDSTPDVTWPRLERRAWLHERVPDPVADGRHRSAAIGVSTLTIVRVRNRSFDGYKMFLSPRSVTVATQRRRYHVVPSGMFQPFIPGESADLLQEQFSVTATAVREFVEELYGVHELETGDGRVDPNAIHRRREALTAVTTAVFTSARGQPSGKLLRAALKRWAFNTARRDDPDCPDDIRSALRWVASHTRPVSALRDPRLLRQVLDGLTVKLDGTPAAPSVTSRRRKILHAALEYAVELELLDKNPMPALKWTPPKTTHGIDRRRVANPIQARTLLHAVDQQRGGRRLVAFFGCLYYAALRPEEAISLAKHNLSLPTRGWGELHVERAEPYAGKEWTDSGRNRDQRPLKQRARGEVRVVPCPPPLTALLHAHIQEFGVQPDGRLFVGERNGGELPTMTIGRMWRRARQAAFTAEVAASPLARTPYDLRHAAVSTWLNGGVPPTTVAEWAGHSVEVLLRIYAKCLDGGDALVRRRVEAALGHADVDTGTDASLSHVRP